MTRFLIATLLAFSLAAPPVHAGMEPLSDEQKKTLANTEDHTPHLDEPGFYALLENIAAWSGELPPAPQLSIPAITAAPGEYRGDPVLIEGHYKGQQKVDLPLKGPWGDDVQQWGIAVGNNRMVQVCLVDPPPVPVEGQNVTIVARFYKVLLRTNEDGREESHLVFVGHSAEVSRGDLPPPLSREQRLQLSTATDYNDQIDEGALYALLPNVAKWPDDMLPAAPLLIDSTAVTAAPQEYRGALMTIEGEFAKAKPEPKKLSRSGPWGDTLHEWTIVIDDEATDIVFVGMVNPPAYPRDGQRVRITGRFYKVIRSYDSYNQPHNNAYFIAHSFAEPGAAQPGAGPKSQSDLMQILGAGVIAVGLAFFFLRRFMKRSGSAGNSAADLIAARREQRERERQRGVRPDKSDAGADDEDETARRPLPKDPVAALALMGGEEGNDGDDGKSDG